MRPLLCVVLLGLLGMQFAAAQEEQDAILRAVRYLSGAASLEEVPQDWVDRLEALSGRKVRVNSTHIRSGGLLSAYQEAALADYRAGAGDILSWEELALVDGFSRECVEALRPFLSLATERNPGVADTLRSVHTTVLARSTLSTLGAKAKVEAEKWRLGGAWRGQDGSFFASYRAGASTYLIGDYNVRLGQGLAAWSGFSMASLSTVDAFIRRSPGLGPVWSYSSASVHRGAAYTYGSRYFRGLVFASLDKTLGAHADYLGRRGQLGISVISQGLDGFPALALDGRLHLRGTEMAGEVAWKNDAPAALAACRLRMGEHRQLALQARWVPSRFSQKKFGEYALAGGFSWLSRQGNAGREASLTCDASLLPVPGQDPRRWQVRVYGQWKRQWNNPWSLELRFTDRYRNYERPRSAFRADLRYASGPWLGTLRGEAVLCEKAAFLAYAEGGWKGSAAAAYLRITGFHIPAWNDRIYCYERDAPGTFSVPAYYGKGGCLSLVGNWKHRFRWFTVKAYIRAAYMIRKEREPTPALNLQLQTEF